MLAYFILLALQGVTVVTPKPAPLAHDYFGVAIDLARDFDGDGVRDLWVGDASESVNCDNTTASIRVVSAKTGRGLKKFAGPEGAFQFGWTIAALGDIDGDGMEDVAASSMVTGGRSHVYALSSANGSVVWSVSGAPELLKESWYSSFAGPALVRVDDWNGDEVMDLAVGWSQAAAPAQKSGLVQVLSGKDGTTLHSWSGLGSSDRFGFALARLPDIDGDGHADLAASAPSALARPDRKGEPALPQSSGYVHLLSSTGKVLRKIESDVAQPMFGAAINTIGDQDGDQIDDLVVSAPFAARGASDLTIWSLSSGTLLRRLPAPDLDAFDGGWQNANVFPNPSPLCKSFGTRLLGVPDRDGDGREDVVATVPQAFCYVPAGVISTSTAKVLGHVELSVRDYEYSHVGITATNTDDIDGDGVRDFALGGGSIRCGSSCPGSVVIVSGKTLVPLRIILRVDVESKQEPVAPATGK